jgi:hypothetical protein
MSKPEWGDHSEHRLTLTHLPQCDGSPVYEGGTDQRSFCADGCISLNDGDFHLPVGKLTEFVATLYEAAGLPAPVILDRPSPIGAALGCYEGGLRVFPDGTAVRVQAASAEPCRHYWHTRLEPAAARKVAATIAAIADAIEGEPDPAEVEELAGTIRAAHHPDSGRPGDGDRTAARAALRWFRDREAQP